MASKRLETAKKFIALFATLDMQVLDSILAENFTHQFAPSSLGIREPLGKKLFIEHLGGLHEIMTGFPVTAKEYIESESSNQVTVWATSLTIFHEDAKDSGIPEKDWHMKENTYSCCLWMRRERRSDAWLNFWTARRQMRS